MDRDISSFSGMSFQMSDAVCLDSMMALITSTALAVFHEHGEYLCIPISKSFVETSCPVMQSSQHALQSSVGLLVFNASNNFLEFVKLRRCVPPRERTIFWWAQSADQIFFSKQA